MLTFLQVIGAITLLALAFWPVSRRVWCALPARGALLAPASGLFCFFLLCQLLWRLGADTHFAWLWAWILLLGAVNWTLLPPPHPPPREFRTGLILFAGSLAFWMLIRASDPGVSHTEQPMDLMWMRAAMASSSPPIRDAWFGGLPATYYADGHQMLAFLALLLGQPASLAVNVGQAVWFALCALMAYASGQILSPPPTRRAGGWIAVVLLLFASTPQGTLDALRETDRHWWWWGASRVLRDGDTELITEFPFFSFWLGDNHAHLLGIPILFIAVLGMVQLRRARRTGLLLYLPSALAVVWSWRVNSWQAPTALALMALGLAGRRRMPSRDLSMALAALAIFLPLLWPPYHGGLFQGVTLNRIGHSSPLDVLAVFAALVPTLLFLIRGRNRSVPVLLTLLAAGLVAVCEVVVIQDVFGTRMNTVFKAYYQAWILLAVAAASGAARGLASPRLRTVALASLLIPAGCLVYAAHLVGGAIAAPKTGLDARAALDPDVRSLVTHADAWIRPRDRIAEAPGISYDASTSRLGTWTAGDTLLGWTGHQAQWRPGTPQPDPSPFYCTDDPARLITLLHQDEIRWVLLGPRERREYAPSFGWMQAMDLLCDRLVDGPDYFLFRVRDR